MLHLLLATFVAGAQAPDLSLSERRAALDEQERVSRRNQRMQKIQQVLLKGFRQISRGTGIDYARSKCSDGWQNSDYERQAGQMCDAGGCIALYAREPERFFGNLFTCYVYMGNGYECFAQGGSVDGQDVHAVFCTDPQLTRHHFEIWESGKVVNKGVDKRPR